MLATGRVAPLTAKLINQISWRVDTIKDPQHYEQVLTENGAQIERALDHGNATGIYFLAPEGNKLGGVCSRPHRPVEPANALVNPSGTAWVVATWAVTASLASAFPDGGEVVFGDPEVGGRIGTLRLFRGSVPGFDGQVHARAEACRLGDGALAEPDLMAQVRQDDAALRHGHQVGDADLQGAGNGDEKPRPPRRGATAGVAGAGATGLTFCTPARPTATSIPGSTPVAAYRLCRPPPRCPQTAHPQPSTPISANQAPRGTPADASPLLASAHR